MLSAQKKDEIRDSFRAALYAVTEEEFEEAKSKLLKQGRKTYLKLYKPILTKIFTLGHQVASYFQSNWFNISDKWTYLGRRHLPTLGNNTTNRLER